MLSRGFASTRKYSLSLDWRNMKTWVAIFVTVGYSLSFYFFFVLVRELFRYLTLMNDQEYLLILSPTETYFYNFFIAFIATMTGTSYGVETLIKTQFQIPGYIRHAISNDFSGLQWLTNYFVARLGLFFGIFASILPIYLTFDFYKEYWFLFPLILLVLFLNQWIRYRYFIRKNSLKVMLSFFVGTTIYSTILIAIPIFDPEAFNHAVLKGTVNYNYTIDLPPSVFKSFINRPSLFKEFFIGYPKKGKIDSAVVVVKEISDPLNSKTFAQWIKECKQTVPLFEEDHLTIGLRVDKSIPMSQVKATLDMLKEARMKNVIFMTSPFRSGISIRLAPHCFEVRPDTSDWQPSCVELNNEMKKSNAFKVRLAGDSIFLNKESSNLRKLSEQLRAWANKYKGNYFIDLDVDNRSSYGSFITVLDSTFQTIISLRQKYATVHFSKTYDHASTIYEDKQLYDTLSKVYPISLILLSDQERKFIDHIK